MTSFDLLRGKIAVITGSGRGIGRAIALELAGHGANVAINYFRHRDQAEIAGDRAIVGQTILMDGGYEPVA
jgi:3-oxoacyl-[acyl-carrier protein] reductase